MSLGRESWLLVVLPLAVLVAAFWALRPATGEDPALANRRPLIAMRAPAAEAVARPPVAEPAAARSVAAATDDESGGSDALPVPAARPDFWLATVVDKDGLPIAGARVRIRRLPTTSFDGDLPLDPAESLFEDVFTDASGRLAVQHFPGWRFDVIVEAAGHGRLFVADFAAADRLVLPDPRDFSGRVLDADQRPVAGATVRIFDGPRDPLEVRTDADGRYVAYGAATAPTLVEVRHREYSAASLAVRTSDEPTANFRMSPGATAAANVGPGGAAASAASAAEDAASSATASDAHGDAESDGGTAYLFDRWTRTLHERADVGDGGRFEFGGLTPGRDYLVAVRSGGRSGEAVFRGGDAFPDFALEASPDLRVAVADEFGRPIEGAAVTLRRFDGLAFDDAPATYTGPDGTTSAPSARAGVRFRIVVYRRGFAVAERRDVALAAGESRTESFRLRRDVPFSGFAMGTDGVPLAGALIRVTRGDRFGAPPLFAYAASDGSFALDGVAEGETVVLVLTPGYSVARDQISLGPEGDVGVLLLRQRDASRSTMRR